MWDFTPIHLHWKWRSALWVRTLCHCWRVHGLCLLPVNTGLPKIFRSQATLNILVGPWRCLSKLTICLAHPLFRCFRHLWTKRKWVLILFTYSVCPSWTAFLKSWQKLCMDFQEIFGRSRFLLAIVHVCELYLLTYLQRLELAWAVLHLF